MKTKLKENPKFHLKRKTEENLSVYFFIIKAPGKELVSIILAYNFDDAFVRAKQDAPGFNVYYHDQKILMRELIDRLYLDKALTPKPEPIIPPKPPELTKEQFIWNLIGHSGEYISKEKGKKKKHLEELIEYLVSKVGNKSKNK